MTPGKARRLRNTLSFYEREVLRQLFREGPTPEKSLVLVSARDRLVEHGYAAVYEGFSYLTDEGMKVCRCAPYWYSKER